MPTDTTAPSEEEGQAADEDGDDNRYLAFFILLFGGGVVGALLWYLRWSAEKYFEVVRISMASGTGVPFPLPISPLAVPRATLAPPEEADKPPIRIDGDAVVLVGGAATAAVVVGTAAEFKALSRATGADDDAPVSATWTVSPSDAATLDAGGQTGVEVVGESVKLVAKKKGVFTLQAAANEFKPGTLTVIATVAQAEAPRIPYAGGGYGTIMIAVVILTIAGVLGVVGALGSEAVATLFGAVAGYIFLKGAQSDGDTARPGSGDQPRTPPPAS